MYVFLGNTVQGRVGMSSTHYSGILYTQSWHKQIDRIWILRKWVLLYGDKFGFMRGVLMESNTDVFLW